MPTFIHSNSLHSLIMYSDLIWYGRKRLLATAIISFLFVVVAVLSLLTGSHPDDWKGWIILIFFGLGFLVTFLQLIWGPIVIANEQGIRIHRHPFAPHIRLYWSEISMITLFTKKNMRYVGFSLAPASIESFLQHQSLFARTILEGKLRHTQAVVIAIPDIFIASVRLILEIENECAEYLQEHHILIKKVL
ncbi:hypothetical protein KSD_72940 [Ktedonobacter sp. SOSP1-85]|uniref:STM3941 family protein n=1 Tax=Ktedonobacter sp. SOSP1-85 TaxID=2778367 RepID=UPI00191552C1|nr:STM3941 family protein [Ktedonobacter sp. SOSP1-85]GHO79523.1 hypothetical protein KSD_72940 [Ktedonobacter sp. SOSP1-85]